MGIGKKYYTGISYGRVSTINQMLDASGSVREDASPVAQKIRYEEHAKFLSQKSGVEYRIAHHISDEGFSAKNVKRPGYQKMWRHVESGSIDFVMASELSRLSRSVTDFLDLVSHCQKNDVDLIIIGLDLDTSTPFGRVIVVILVALAQFEREMTSMRVKENALARLLKDGKINGGAAILGLDRDPDSAGHYIRNDKELQDVESIMKIFLKVPGKAQTIEEAKKLGIRSKQGNEFNLNSMTLLLENAQWRYRGLWYANKENKDKDPETLAENKRYQEVALPHGPLLDTKLLDQVVKKLGRSRTKIMRGLDSYVYLLSGIMTHEDGSKFEGQHAKQGKYRYYYNRALGMRLHCDMIDELVRETIKEHFVSTKECRQIVRRGFKALEASIPGFETRVGELQKELTQLRKREKEITKAFSTEKLSDPVYSKWLKAQINEMAKEKERLEWEIESLRQQKSDFFSENRVKGLEEGLKSYIDDGFDNIPRQAQRAIIERIIPSVVIKQSNEMEVKISIPCAKSVTMEDESHGKVWNGGRDGT